MNLINIYRMCYVGVLLHFSGQSIGQKLDTSKLARNNANEYNDGDMDTRALPVSLADFASQLLNSVKTGNTTAVASILASPFGQGVIKTLPPDVQKVLLSGNMGAIMPMLASEDSMNYLRSLLKGQPPSSSAAETSTGQLQSLIGSLLGKNTNLQGLLQSLMSGNTSAITSLLSSPAVQGLLMTLPPNVRSALMSGNFTAISSVLSSPEAQAYLKSIVSGASGNSLNPNVQSQITSILKGLTSPKAASNPLGGLLSGLTGGNIGMIMGLEGAKQKMAAFGVSQVCQDDLQKILVGLQSKQMWAMQMVDAGGKIPDGLLYEYSTKKFLGDFDECRSITATGTENGKEVHYFKAKFCREYLYLLKDNLLPGLTGTIGVGQCVSERCSNKDVEGMLKAAQQILMNGSMLVWPTSDCVEDWSMGTGEIAVLCVLIMFGVLMAVATLYDVFAVQLDLSIRPRTNKYELELSGVENLSFKDNVKETVATGNGFVNGKPATNGDVQGAVDGASHAETIIQGVDSRQTTAPKANDRLKKERTVLEQIILAFSVYTNGVKILGTNQASGSLGAINGVRFLSMAWVILGHTYYFTNGYDENIYSFMLEKVHHWTFMFIPYATVSVDSFFAISGILVAYLTLKELKKSEGPKKFNWLMFYFHRFWRLTPPYMLLIMVGTVLVPYFSDGPMWKHEDNPNMAGCRHNWWTNLLYVNNYVKTDEMCMGWSWYLANDMQFYIISPLILLPLFYNMFAGIGVSMVLLLASLIATGAIASIHHYPVQLFIDGIPKAKDGDYMKNVYLPSYARIGPYLIGLFTGYVLWKLNCKCKINRAVNLAAWVLCIGVCCVIVYSPFSKDGSHVMGVSESAAYMTLTRTVWGIAVCWIVFACACGYGGWINELLSWKAFIPLGRLTYCAYLVHPICINVFGASLRRPFYFTDYSLVYLFFGSIMTAYGVAFIASLAFESPMMALEKAIFKRGKI